MSNIKQCIDIVSTPLAHIINLSISNGIVPDEMKIAHVIPLYKSGDCELIVNYRPVSILPSFSNRLLNYIDKHEILCNSEYGFRKQHSTTLALIDMYDKISSSIDQGKCSVGVFLALSKAFDTVNHDILLNKLDYYGIHGLSLDWFKVILLIGLSLLSLMGLAHLLSLFHVVCPKDQFLVHYYFYCTSMIWVKCLIWLNLYCLQMIPTFFVWKKICILYRLC